MQCRIRVQIFPFRKVHFFVGFCLGLFRLPFFNLYCYFLFLTILPLELIALIFHCNNLHMHLCVYLFEKFVSLQEIIHKWFNTKPNACARSSMWFIWVVVCVCEFFLIWRNLKFLNWPKSWCFHNYIKLSERRHFRWFEYHIIKPKQNRAHNSQKKRIYTNRQLHMHGKHLYISYGYVWMILFEVMKHS